MFFKQDCLSFRILDVVALDQTNVNLAMSGRNFDALSYRFSADTVLKTETQSLTLSDGAVVFAPSRVNYSRISRHDRLIAVHIHTENYFSGVLEAFSASDSAFFESKFQALLEAWNAKEVGYQYRCAAILNEILEECYRENDQSHTDYGAINDAVKYLHEHFTDPALTVRELAAKSFMSEVYFRKLFRAQFNTSPSKYIIRLRIQHAIGLMATGYYSLKEIAFLSGYTDYPYFSAEFKRIKGITPSEYLYNFDSATASEIK